MRMNLKRMSLVVAVCALVGALAGIAGSAAAPSKSSPKASERAQIATLRARAQAIRRQFRMGMRPRLGFGPGPMMFGPVHAEAVVPKPDGSGFLTITTDSGTLNSVDGSTLHLKEGTDKATYKDDVAIDVGSNVTVIRDHAKAALSDLKQGDHVRVIQGTPRGTLVMAEDDAFLKQEQQDHHGWGHGAPWGPPPGDPGAPAPPGAPGGSNQNGSTTGQPGANSNS